MVWQPHMDYTEYLCKECYDREKGEKTPLKNHTEKALSIFIEENEE